MKIKELIKIAYSLAEIASKKLPKLDKDMEQVIVGAFEKRFKELNKNETL